MGKLDNFIKALERNSDMAALVEQISSGKLEVPSPQDVQAHLDSLPEAKRGEIQTLLVNTIESVSAYTGQLEIGMEETKKQIDLNLDMGKACQSYSSHQDGSTKRKK